MDSEDDYDSSSLKDDIDSITLLPDRSQRSRIQSWQKSAKKMCGPRTILFGSVVSLVLISVVLLGVFVRPSSSDDENSSPSENDLFRDKDGNPFSWQELRLPRTLRPLQYLVKLEVDLKTFMFNGTVEIRFICDEPTSNVVLHAKNMELQLNHSIHHEVPVEGIGKKKDYQRLSVKDRIQECEKLEMISVRLENQQVLLPREVYVLRIQFGAKLSDKLVGFYKSSYRTASGEKRYLATTHFEPTDARAAFPCFDEPEMKATFKIIMRHAKEYTALSNMPVEKSDLDGDWVVDHFQESVQMSTYLTAFVVCDYRNKSKLTKRNNVKVSVWAPPDKINAVDFALDSAVKTLDYYEEFFDIDYPLPKQDLIAIPDFDAGAMENWGLITYRLTSLLYDPKTSPDSSKQWVAIVVAHELAHQWFGDLVTMKWWNDLWLNEGFASFVEDVGVDHLFPAWKMMDQFVSTKVFRSLSLDQMSNSHPIQVEVHDPAQINAIFDTISYNKGASIINMLKYILGNDVFFHGLREYLKQHKFGNAETKDLWQALSKASEKKGKNLDVKEMMDTWTQQMGFPLVTIHQLVDGRLMLSQRHYRIHPKAKTALESPFNYKWEVPLTLITDQASNSPRLTWVREYEVITSARVPPDMKWLKANVGQKGFYRVNYDVSNWEALIEQLNTDHLAFAGADRAGLIDDALSLGRSGELDQTIALSTTKYLTKEREYVPWKTALANLGYIGAQFSVSDNVFNEDHGQREKQNLYATFKRYVAKQLEATVRELGWHKDDDTHLNILLRPIVLHMAAVYGDTEVLREAKERFEQWQLHGEDISDPNLGGLVYSLGVRAGDEQAWEFVHQKYKEEPSATKKRTLMYALSATEDEGLLNRLLTYSLDDAEVRSQDSTTVISAVASNPAGRLLAWKFVKANYETLYNRYGQGSFSFSRLIATTTGHFNTHESLHDVREFFNNKPLGSAQRAVAQSLESISANIDWMDDNRDKVNRWLEDQTWP